MHEAPARELDEHRVLDLVMEGSPASRCSTCPRPRDGTGKTAPVDGPPAWRVQLGRADVRTSPCSAVLAALV